MKKIDTCGMSCPQPVLMTKKALEQNPEGVDIIIDNRTAKENIERFLNNSGYKTEFCENDDTFIISARK